jgi:hypothetical protein
VHGSSGIPVIRTSCLARAGDDNSRRPFGDAPADPALWRNAVHQAERIQAGIAADRAVAELEALARFRGVGR